MLIKYVRYILYVVPSCIHHIMICILGEYVLSCIRKLGQPVRTRTVLLVSCALHISCSPLQYWKTARDWEQTNRVENATTDAVKLAITRICIEHIIIEIDDNGDASHLRSTGYYPCDGSVSYSFAMCYLYRQSGIKRSHLLSSSPIPYLPYGSIGWKRRADRAFVVTILLSYSNSYIAVIFSFARKEREDFNKLYTTLFLT